MTYENIKLTFRNLSNDTNNSTILIFQQNVAESFGELAVAWRVIRNCGRLDSHEFKFPLQFKVAARDSWGNTTPLLTAYDGQAFDMTLDNSGDVLALSRDGSTSPAEVEIRNKLKQGAISACIYKDGRLLATKTNMAPGQKAVFQFQPRIYIGVASQIEEGQVINSAIISQANTEINLFGITSADIVMTGGGPGPNSQPLEFNLDNVNQ